MARKQGGMSGSIGEFYEQLPRLAKLFLKRIRKRSKEQNRDLRESVKFAKMKGITPHLFPVLMQ